MSNRSENVTPELLRRWGMPDPGTSKKTRGQIVVVGGSRRTPGAVILAGEAGLRVGAGRLACAVPGSVGVELGLAVPEAAVFTLPDDSAAPFEGDVREAIEEADVVLLGPGFDDPAETRETLLAAADCAIGCLVLDAYALGILPDVPRTTLPTGLVLTPNEEEAAILLGRELGGDRGADLREIARRYDAVVACYGDIATPDGERWEVSAGGPGLGTSGSGDVLAGAVAGVVARGVDPARAAVWGTWVHARAGDRLTDRTGIGFLARDILPELTVALNEVVSPAGEPSD